MRCWLFHKWGRWDYIATAGMVKEQERQCERCGKIQIEPIHIRPSSECDHQWSKWETAPGKLDGVPITAQFRTCALCNKKEVEPL